MEVLQAKNLKKIYGSGNNAVHALDGVDLSVKKGEFVAIVGTSGSGKSTLLHMLGGLDRPTSGTVMVDGQDIFSLKEEALTIFRRRKIGFVFQAYNLVPVLNVYENIVLPIELDGGKVNKDFVQQIVQTLGLDQTDHEQLGDGEAHGRAEQDKVGARGDDGAEDGAGGDDAARAAGLIPSLRHHGQEQAAEGSGFAHGTAHQTRENHAGHDGGIAEAAADAADDELRKLDHPLRQAAFGHDFTGEHEEGDGHQGIVVRAVQHGLRDDHDEHAVPHAAVIHQDHRTQDKHDGDRNAQREEAEQADQKDDKFHVLSPIPFWARC